MRNPQPVGGLWPCRRAMFLVQTIAERPDSTVKTLICWIEALC